MSGRAIGSMGGVEQAVLTAFDSAVAPLAVGVAVLIGAAHGVAPGHGKTLVAGYLLGAGGSRRHAVALAGSVAFMHTASVLVLGAAWWLAVDDGPVPLGDLTRWMRLGLASVVLVVGVYLVRRRWRGRGTVHDHHHHDHVPAGRSWPAVAGIASVGGLIPSPSAFLLLVSGLLTGRSVLAVGMVAAFGLGIGATVLVVGLMTVAGRDWLDRHIHRGRVRAVVRAIPLVGAAGVLVGGGVLWTTSLVSLAGGG